MDTHFILPVQTYYYNPPCKTHLLASKTACMDTHFILSVQTTYHKPACEINLLPKPSAWTPISSCLWNLPTTILLVKSTCFQTLDLHGHPFHPACANHLPQSSLWNQSTFKPSSVDAGHHSHLPVQVPCWSTPFLSPHPWMPVWSKSLYERPRSWMPVLSKPVYERPHSWMPVLSKPLYERSYSWMPVLSKPVYERLHSWMPVLSKPLYERPHSWMPVLSKPFYREPHSQTPALLCV